MYKLNPYIYTIRALDEKERVNGQTHMLIDYAPSFKLPDVIYGNIEKTATRVWNTFAISRKSTGILLTGESGSGKSLLGELICNLAISKGIPVINIVNIRYTAELLDKLTRMDNVVLFMDEFGKNVEHKEQGRMLTFFSDTNTRKLFIITENSKYSISPYVLNRPGRIRYHIDYSKVPKDIVEDYLIKNNVEASFQEDLMTLYLNSRIFSFDHLQSIVSEHERYPEETLDELIEILNLGILQKPYVVQFKNIIDLKSGEDITESADYNKNKSYDSWCVSDYEEISLNVRIPIGSYNSSEMYGYEPTDGRSLPTHLDYRTRVSVKKCVFVNNIYTFQDSKIKLEIHRVKQGYEEEI